MEVVSVRRHVSMRVGISRKAVLLRCSTLAIPIVRILRINGELADFSRFFDDIWK